MLKQLSTLTVFVIVLGSTSACSREKEQVGVKSVVPTQKIAQKVVPLEPTFKPKQAPQPVMGQPITIPPIGG